MMQITTSYPVRVGVQLHPQHTSYESFANAVSRAEEIGVDSIWNWDHFFPVEGDPQGNHFEGWTLLTAIAMLTTRAEIGCLVTCNSYRNPALVSNMAKTVDHISNGRLVLGIGAGWFERDYYEYGYDFGTAKSRLAALKHAISVILHRWEVDVPRPLRYPIPILLGGGSEEILRIAAEHATMWHDFGDIKTVAHKVQILHQKCLEVGRNPHDIECFTTINADATDDERNAYLQIGVTHLILDLEFPWNFDALQELVRWRDRKRAS